MPYEYTTNCVSAALRRHMAHMPHATPPTTLHRPIPRAQLPESGWPLAEAGASLPAFEVKRASQPWAIGSGFGAVGCKRTSS